jgi:hypothetical protein
MPPQRTSVLGAGQSTPAVALNKGLDPLQLTAWALVRGRQGAPLDTPSLASGGTLGGSQAGARLTYNFTRQIGATLRTTSEVGRRGGEVALARASSRSSACPCGSRSNGTSGSAGSAAAATHSPCSRRAASTSGRCRGASSSTPISGASWSASAAQIRSLTAVPPSRDRSTATSQVASRVWGAGQGGVYRVDAGPRVSMKVRNNVRVHFDWRQKLAGNAQPGSGPAVTLAGDF